MKSPQTLPQLHLPWFFLLLQPPHLPPFYCVHQFCLAIYFFKFLFYLAHYLILHNKNSSRVKRIRISIPFSLLCCKIIFMKILQKLLEPVGKEKNFQWGYVGSTYTLVNLSSRNYIILVSQDFLLSF